MGIISQVSGYTNIGHDLQVTMAGAGAPQVLPNVMSVEWKQITDSFVVNQIDGIPLPAEIPKGWEGSIEFHRADNTIEHWFATLQAQWLTNADLAASLGTIICTVAGQGGGVFTFTNVAWKLDDGGSWKGDEVTKCRISFKAAQMFA